MTFHDKLDRLTQHSNFASLSRAAGLPPGTLSALLKHRYMPSVDKSLA